MVRVVTERAAGGSQIFDGKVLRPNGTRRGPRAKRPTQFRPGEDATMPESIFTGGRRERRGNDFPADHADERGLEVI